ncbi:hypothetical protein ACOK4R_31825 (plasmid) [Pseudomonas fluorescens]|uniref:hypothetical protein n=1 Tax=Pseudomonas fluorescens TaxID=294 RepID=UPI001FD45B9A|nr:hypothetical protein [Pseudomonas fluorescens]
MTQPTMLKGVVYFRENPRGNDTYWPISVAEIREVQDTFVTYMEHGLSLDHVCQHVDNSQYGMDADAVHDCALAFCAAALCIPHPRLSDLILYVREITRNNDSEVSQTLERLFNYNLIRKYEVMASITSDALDLLGVVAPVGVEDCILTYLINDKAIAPRIYAQASASEREKTLARVRYFPERSLGYLPDNPEYLGHREIIDLLVYQARAMMGVPDSTSRKYSLQLWADACKPSLDEPFSLLTMRCNSHDHGILDLEQTVRTLKAFGRECIAAIIKGTFLLYKDKADPVLLEKMMNAFQRADISKQEVFYLLCARMTHVEYADHEACRPTSPDHFIREMLRFTDSSNPLPFQQIALRLLESEPLAVIIDACNDDRTLNVAYGHFRDRRLLLKMSGSARDVAFGGDMGL